MSSRGKYNDMTPSNEYNYRSYGRDEQEKKVDAYSDSEYSTAQDHRMRGSSHQKFRSFEHKHSDSFVKPQTDSKKIIKKGTMEVSDGMEARGVRFIKQHWDELK